MGLSKNFYPYRLSYRQFSFGKVDDRDLREIGVSMTFCLFERHIFHSIHFFQDIFYCAKFLKYLLMMTSTLNAGSGFYKLGHFAVNFWFFPLLKGRFKKLFVLQDELQVFLLLFCAPLIPTSLFHIFQVRFISFY